MVPFPLAWGHSTAWLAWLRERGGSAGPATVTWLIGNLRTDARAYADRAHRESLGQRPARSPEFVSFHPRIPASGRVCGPDDPGNGVRGCRAGSARFPGTAVDPPQSLPMRSRAWPETRDGRSDSLGKRFVRPSARNALSLKFGAKPFQLGDFHRNGISVPVRARFGADAAVPCWTRGSATGRLEPTGCHSSRERA